MTSATSLPGACLEHIKSYQCTLPHSPTPILAIRAILMFSELLHYLVAGVTRMLVGFNQPLKCTYMLQSTLLLISGSDSGNKNNPETLVLSIVMQSFASCMAEAPKTLKSLTSSFSGCGLCCIPGFTRSWFVYSSEGGENCLKGTGLFLGRATNYFFLIRNERCKLISQVHLFLWF